MLFCYKNYSISFAYKCIKLTPIVCLLNKLCKFNEIILKKCVKNQLLNVFMYKSLSKNFHNLIPYRCGSTKKRGFRFLESPFLKNMVKCDSITELS